MSSPAHIARVVVDAILHAKALAAKDGATLMRSDALVVAEAALAPFFQPAKPKAKAAPKPKATATDAEWLAELAASPAYAGINVAREFEKMKVWATTNKQPPTRRRFINWLNRAQPDRVLGAPTTAKPGLPAAPAGWWEAARLLYPDARFILEGTGSATDWEHICRYIGKDVVEAITNKAKEIA